MIKTLLFVSGNKRKLVDIMDLAGSLDQIQIEHYEHSINELQNVILKDIVEHKRNSAFNRLRRPIFVDHTCLSLSAFNGFPGTNSSAFWDAMGGNICSAVHSLGKVDASVEVGIGYADAYNTEYFSAQVDGTIAARPKGKRDFDWDRVFIPSGETRTFAEMTISQKNAISPRARAFSDMINYLKAKVN